jgi:predicted PurR-regulated permease PerM
MPVLPTTPNQDGVRIEPADSPSSHALLTVCVTVVVVAGLYVGRSVLIPITLAVLLSFLLAPLVALLRRLYLGRVPSVLLAVLLALTLILGLGGLIGTQVAELAQEVPTYAEAIQQKVDTVQQLMLSRVTSLTAKLSHQTPPANPASTRHSGGPASGPGAHADPDKPLQVEVRQPDLTAIELARRLVTPVVEPLSTTAIVLIVSVFILLQREDLRDRMIRLFGSSDLYRTTVAMNDAARRLSRYLLTQLAVNASFGVIIGSGLAWLGVPSPVMWGVLGALLRFVPYVGAPLAALVPLTLAAAIDPGWSMVLWTASLYLFVEVILGQAVEPHLYGRSTGLSPFSVVVAATFWTWLWGPIGLILSTPMTLCLVVLGRHVARLKFLDVLLGDTPALTPIQSFYQRILAGDPDEARDQAEILLKDLSLSSYYDEVALNGLRLAAADAERDRLTPGHLARVKSSIQSLIDDLQDHEDDTELPGATGVVTLPPNAAEAAPDSPAADAAAPSDPALASASTNAEVVLCIAGRGSLDDEVSAMLAQLLAREGLASRIVPYSATGRATISQLDMSGVVMVCVSYLTLTANPSHLKYLLRRLRVRLPRNVPITVGIWPVGETQLLDDRMRAALGASFYANSLQEAVTVCLNAASERAADALSLAVAA